MNRALALGVVAGIASMTFVAPAEAAAPHTSNRPMIEVTQDDFTIPIPAGEACDFPITFRGVGTATVKTQRQKVKTVISDAVAIITNTTTGKSVRLNADTVFVDHLRKDGSSRSTSSGNAFIWGDLTIKGQPAPSGILMIQGKSKFTIENYADQESGVNFTQIKGKVTDVCTLID